MIEKLKMRRNFYEQVFEKIRTSPQSAAAHILMSVYAFVLASGKISGSMAPFGISLISACPYGYASFAFAGASLGYIIGQPFVMIIRYIALMAVLRLFSLKIAEKHTSYEEIWFLPPLTVLSFTFLSGVIAIIFQSFTSDKLIAVLCESLISAVSSYFFNRSFEIKDFSKGLSCIRTKDLVCLIYSCSAFILAFSVFNIKEIMLSKIIAGFLILVCSYFGHEGAGSIAGICGGISVGIYTSSLSDVVSMSFSGLICGAFSPLGRAGTSVSYIISQTVVFLIAGQKENLFLCAVECAVSIGLFLIIPKKHMPSLQNFFNSSVRETVSVEVRKNISGRLEEASQCISGISQSIDKVSEGLKRASDSSDKSVYCRVQNEICKQCRKYDVCWEKNFSATYKYFENIASVFRESERVELENLPKKFVNSCLNPEDFLRAFEKNYRRSRAKAEEEIKTTNMRNMFYDQLGCMSEALETFAEEFIQETSSDTATASKIKSLLRDSGVNVMNVLCTVDSKGAMTIEARCRNIDDSLDKSALCREIENMTLRKFERPSLRFLENGITITFMQKPWMSIDVGSIQYPSENSSFCGDYCENFYDSGKEVIVISDGMGTGGRAAVDAAMTAEFFGKLIRSGFSEDCALKIVNSAMLVKSSYESLSTVDTAKIDLFTGRIEFFKAGAAASFIRKNGKCSVIESSSLPVGILRDISFAKENITVSPGDIIVMVSDGVTSDGTEWIEKEIESWKHNDPAKLAQKIAFRAAERNDRRPPDDITVIAGIIS